MDFGVMPGSDNPIDNEEKMRFVLIDEARKRFGDEYDPDMFLDSEGYDHDNPKHSLSARVNALNVVAVEFAKEVEFHGPAVAQLFIAMNGLMSGMVGVGGVVNSGLYLLRVRELVDTLIAVNELDAKGLRH